MESGHWPLYRYDPRLIAEGRNPFQLDSKPPKIALRDYIYNETRYKMLEQSNPESARQFLVAAQEFVNQRWRKLEQMAKIETAPENQTLA